jgi:hypothetical protein
MLDVREAVAADLGSGSICWVARSALSNSRMIYEPGGKLLAWTEGPDKAGGYDAILAVPVIF